VESTIELTGAGLGKPMVLTFEQLAGMEMTRLDNVLMQKSHEADEITSWRGPSLDALLTAAQIKPGSMTLTLEAADGYAIECSPEEMESAIVALQDGEGRWLAETDETCPIRLVPPKKPGNYWIMNLRRITVEPAAPGPPGWE
jgi:DMSO/TMAO reductase YedYZ molybdopterin-dependent catalytic subunit